MSSENPPGFAAPPPGFSGPPGIGGPAARPPRPATVTIAVALMGLQIVLLVIGAVVQLLTKDQLAELFRKAPKQPGGPDPAAMANISLGVGLCITVVVAVAFAVLAVLNLRGNNVARIITWVLAGVFVCCTIGAVVSSFLNSGVDLPGWYVAYGIADGVLRLLALIGTIVLLALPASNAYFKPKPAGQLY